MRNYISLTVFEVCRIIATSASALSKNFSRCSKVIEENLARFGVNVLGNWGDFKWEVLTVVYICGTERRL